MRRSTTRVLVIGLALGLAACSSSPPSAPAPAERTITATPSASGTSGAIWPTYHGDNARTGVAAGLAPVTRITGGWAANLDGAVYGQPLVVDGLVLAATENDTVYA